MLIFIIGLPGTGKTTIAKWLSDRFNVKYLSTEELRAEYLGVNEEKNDCDFSEDQQIIIYSMMVERARSIIDKDGSIIVEGVYRTKEQRDTIIRLFSEYDEAKFYFWITCGLNENRRRVIIRKNGGTISPAGIVGFEKIKGEFVFPDSNEPYITIDNTYGLSDVEKTIEKYISERERKKRENIMYYIYTNRFQPLNILNEKEIKWLASNIGISDRIIIGIVNPVPTEQESATAGDLHDIWIRGAVKYNPLTFWQRYLMIKNFVKNNEDLREKVEAIIPHARPSTNMVEARKYLPNKYIECLSTPQQNDEEYIKRMGLIRQSETVFEIPSHTFGAEYTLITPELICCLVAVGSTEWGRFVSDETKKYLDSLKINDLVSNNLKKKDAEGILKKIYNRESDQEEQKILFPIVRKYVKDISNPEKLKMNHNDDEIDTDSQMFINKVYSLAEEINGKLGRMQVHSPRLFEKMQKTLDELYNLADDVKEGQITLNEREQLYANLFKIWNSRRG